MLDFIVYLLYRGGAAIISALSLPLLFVLGEFLGFCAWLILPGYRRLARRNVSIAFGNEKSPRQLRRLVPAPFSTVGRQSFVQRQTYVHASRKDGDAN